MKVVILLLCLTASFQLRSSEEFLPNRANKDEVRLLANILNGYEKRTRPTENFHIPLLVNMSIHLNQIIQVDEKNQIVTLNLWRNILWNDDFLQWNPSDYGNITQLSLVRTQIWVPDIQLYNSATYDTQYNSENKVIVRNNGLTHEVLPMLVKSTCKIDVTWFPFDEQKCSLVFGCWTESYQEVLLKVLKHEIAFVGYVEFTTNGEWQLLDITAEEQLQYDPRIPTEKYVVITYTIHLKRRAFYYFFTLLVPCALIGFLAILGFTLPPESGEKLSLGASILFSLIVFLNTISQSMPANSDVIPLLGTYFNCVMFTIALSVVSTIVVNLNMKAMNAEPVRGLSKKVFLHWLPWMLHYKVPIHLVEGTEQKRPRKIKVGDSGSAESLFCAGKVWKQQWIFIAAVVDRLCLVCSLLFLFVSVVIFLINAF